MFRTLASLHSPSCPPSRAARRRVAKKGRRPGLEPLEDRCVPAAHLYIDFGDAFVAGNGLMKGKNDAVTIEDFKTAVNGPTFDLQDKTILSFTSFNQEARAFGLNATQIATLRADVLSLVRRYYAPFDVTVVQAQARSLEDIQNTLRGNTTNDAYVLVAGITPQVGTIPQGRNGEAGGEDHNTAKNATDDTAVVLARNLFQNGSAGTPAALQADTAFAHVIAHEAAHTFGLDHTVNAPTANNTTRLLMNSEIIGQFYNTGVTVDQRASLNSFTRYALPRAHTTGNYVPYERLAENVGLRPGAPTYVTGTGAHDLITISRNAGTNQATVSVQAYSTGPDAAGNFAAGNSIRVPGTAGNTYSYQITLDRPIVLDAGMNNDRIVLDGNLGVMVTVRGMHGTDSLVVQGQGAASATYLPGMNTANGLDGLSDLRGSVIVGSTAIHFQELDAASQVTVQDVGTLTVRTPGGMDGLTVTSAEANQNQVAGTVAGGATIAQVQALRVTNLTLETGAGEGVTTTDGVNVQSTGAGTTLRILTGAGKDAVTIGLAGSVANIAGAVAIDGHAAVTVDARNDAWWKLVTVDVIGRDQRVRNLATADVSFAGRGEMALLGPAGTNFYDIRGTAAGITTTLDTWLGNATVTVLGTTGALNVTSSAPTVTATQARNDVIVRSLASVVGTVNVSNTAGRTTLRVDDSAHSGPRLFRITNTSVSAGQTTGPSAFVTYDRNVSRLEVIGGSGSGDFQVESTSAATPLTVTTGAGTNKVFIGRGTIGTATGSNRIRVPVSGHTLADIAGPVHVQASNVSGRGSTSVIIDGSLDAARDMTVTSGLARLGDRVNVTFSGIGQLDIVQGSGRFRADVQSVPNELTVWNTQPDDIISGPAAPLVKRNAGLPPWDGRTLFDLLPPIQIAQPWLPRDPGPLLPIVVAPVLKLAPIPRALLFQ